MAAGSWPRTSGTRTSPCRWRPRTPRGSIEGPLPLPGGGSMATVRDMLAKKGSDVITIAPSETVLRAAELMNGRGIGGLVVADRRRARLPGERAAGDDRVHAPLHVRSPVTGSGVQLTTSLPRRSRVRLEPRISSRET